MLRNVNDVTHHRQTSLPLLLEKVALILRRASDVLYEQVEEGDHGDTLPYSQTDLKVGVSSVKPVGEEGDNSVEGGKEEYSYNVSLLVLDV